MESATGWGSPRFERRLTGAVVLAAGLVAVASYAVGWASLTYPATLNGPTVTASVGHAIAGLFAGAILAVAGVVLLRTAPGETHRAWAATTLVCGLFLAGVAAFDVATVRDRALHALMLVKLASAPPGASHLREMLAAQARVAHFSFGAGIYLAIAAAVMAMVGSILALGAFRRTAPARIHGR